jgi:chromosome partitioning protein
MAITIAIANQKGGVGKTTSAFNLAHALVEHGQRVLCIDADPQASLTEYFGLDPDLLEDQHQTLYFALVGDEPVPLSTLVVGDNPALIPTSIQLANADPELRQHPLIEPQSVLRKQLREIRDNYDFIIIDCQPSLGILPINALAAADLVLVPVETTRLSRSGLRHFFNTITRLRRHLNPRIEVLGILPTKYAGHRNHDNEQLGHIQQFAAERRLPVLEPIRDTTLFDKASAAGVPVSTLRAGPKVIENYQHIAAALIERTVKPQEQNL